MSEKPPSGRMILKGRTRILKPRFGDADPFSIPFIFLAILAISAAMAGCGGRGNPPNCIVGSLNVTPATATANHVSASPGNQAQFFGTDATNLLPAGCVSPAITQAMRNDLKWTTSDPANVSIGNTVGVNYGLATCNNATAAAVTITATGPNGNNDTIAGTAKLTCN